MGNNNEPNNEASAFLYLDDSIDCKCDLESAQCTDYFLNHTGESTKMSDHNSPNPEQLNNKVFKIAKSKFDGRKRKRDYQNNKKVHSKYDNDNIIRKVQVHFQNFLVSFINEILLNFGISKKFLNIDYKNKKNVKKENVEKMKLIEIGQILRQNISTKYKKQYEEDKEKNNKLYLEIIKNDSIRKILSETYINIFRNFYYKNKRDLDDYGLNIKLSNNVKTYQDFLEEQKEDIHIIEKINNIVEKCYLPKKLFIYN